MHAVAFGTDVSLGGGGNGRCSSSCDNGSGSGSVPSHDGIDPSHLTPPSTSA